MSSLSARSCGMRAICLPALHEVSRYSPSYKSSIAPNLLDCNEPVEKYPNSTCSTYPIATFDNLQLNSSMMTTLYSKLQTQIYQNELSRSCSRCTPWHFQLQLRLTLLCSVFPRAFIVLWTLSIHSQSFQHFLTTIAIDPVHANIWTECCGQRERSLF